jgi:hypothetical protein
MYLFDSYENAENACGRLKESGCADFELITTAPINIGKSRAGLFAFIGALVGFILSVGFIYWTSAVDYPLNTGSMGHFRILISSPVIFELTALFAVIGCIVNFIFEADLPDYETETDMINIPSGKAAILFRGSIGTEIEEIIRNHGGEKIK